MFTNPLSLLLLASATAVLGQQNSESAVVTIEQDTASRPQSNTTITVPLFQVYTNASALKEVSTLYLTGSHGIAEGKVLCTPYKATNGQGSGGLSFYENHPSYLSTNTVVVGSIVCNASAPAQ